MTTSPPTGTVTFLFTDIEGSTKLWERHPEAMQRALARHDEILSQAIEDHGGYVFKTVGDAFCAAFDTASGALEASLEAQRALLSEEWGKTGPLRVRMALHTGAAEERGGDYFGPAVNRVARLLSAGHGGQSLLSLSTQELVRDQLPSETSLRDLGERRLKDLFRPERVFQLLSPELPASFPALKTLDARLNNLPVQPTPLVGREKELAEVTGLLRREEVRVLTLTGPGGTGKTRLALQAAADQLDEFEDGAFFVPLAPITDSERVAPTVAGALGVQEVGGRPPEEALKEHLRKKELLLLLDNFEQVVEASPLVGDLLSACPRLKVLATSRAPLEIYGEQEYAVSPLSLPALDRFPDLEALSQYEAVRLFIERAKAARPDFSVTNENAPAVAEICVRLDGLPLAIELAAARTKVLTPQAMLTRLGSRLKLLKGGVRDLPERQRTLKGTIDWSYGLLEEDEKTLFGRMAAFVGGCTLEAAESVCEAQGDLGMDTLDGVESLVDKNLLRREEGPEAETRFVMLETIREYALERLEQSGEAGSVRRTHAEHYLTLAEEAETELTGPAGAVWLERLGAEHDNFRAALSWSLERGEFELALRLAAALGAFWTMRGYLSEGAGWLDAALSGEAPKPARANALFRAGAIATHQGDPERAHLYAEQSATLYREAGDKRGLARTLNILGHAVADQGDLRQAEAFYRQAGALGRELGDEQQVLYSLLDSAWAALCQDEYERAAEASQQSLVLARSLGNEALVGASLSNLGVAALERGDDVRALALHREALEIFRELGDPVSAAEGLEGIAGAIGEQDEGGKAARLYAAAEALRAFHDAPVLPGDLPRYDRRLSAARAHVDETTWKQAWEEGRAMTMEDAVSYALEQAATRG